MEKILCGFSFKFQFFFLLGFSSSFFWTKTEARRKEKKERREQENILFVSSYFFPESKVQMKTNWILFYVSEAKRIDYPL